MNKIFKLSVTFSLAFVIMLSGIAIVKADGRWYNSSISISNHSSLLGKERTYEFDNYRTDITPNSMETGVYSIYEVILNTRLVRPLYRLGIHYGNETKFDEDISFDPNATGIKKIIHMGNCGNGKRYLAFSTAKGAKGTGSMQGLVDIYNYS